MRPGRNAPDNAEDRHGPDGNGRASMRPGRNAPDNPSPSRSAPLRTAGFNEAGAKCPG